jgi:fructosamine-3-kinase
MPDWSAVCRTISEATGEDFAANDVRPVAGGCINQAWVMAEGCRVHFVKTNRAAALSMFEAELAGLETLAYSATVRVPRPLCVGSTADLAWLVLEYLPLSRRDSPRNDAQLGESLAAMHRCLGPTFGWDRDNTIGATPQHNPASTDWPGFWREHRLNYQLKLAHENGYRAALEPEASRLLNSMDDCFTGYFPVASLLHGDLWSGNAAELESGEPVLFDPAVYYGDREADLAMTELFGGFGSDFYAAYVASWPLDAGYPVRRDFYNLYHVLNHLNLFGTGYLAQAQRLLRGLLAELR